MIKRTLTEEEISELISIQEKTQEFIRDLGEIEFMMIQLKNKKENLEVKISDLNNLELNTHNNLHKKYGDITINPNSWEIIEKN